MQRVVLATGNAGKLREMRAILSDACWEVVPQSDFNTSEAVEDGLSFVENAIIKARHACAHTGLGAIADDSGLEVDALQGAPGIFSARYAGVGASDRDNLEKLLLAMRDVPAQQRGARFRCVMVFMRHQNDPSPIICEGSWDGMIAEQPQGEGGFGYDPIFYLPSEQCSSAELSAEQKNALSHRGKALKALSLQLDTIKT